MSGAQFLPIIFPKNMLIYHASNCSFIFSMRNVKASHSSAQVQHLYESYFLLLKQLSEVQRYAINFNTSLQETNQTNDIISTSLSNHSNVNNL